MKTIWGIIIVVCLVFVGCGDFKKGDWVYVQDSMWLEDGAYQIESVGTYWYIIQGKEIFKSDMSALDAVTLYRHNQRISKELRQLKNDINGLENSDKRISDNFYMIDLLFKHLGVEAVWIEGHHELIRTEDGTHILEMVLN